MLEYCSLGVNNGHLRLQWDGCDVLFTCAKNVSVLTAYARARVLEWLCTCIDLSVISRVMRFRFVKICVVSHFEKRHSTAWAEMNAFLLKMSFLSYVRSTTIKWRHVRKPEVPFFLLRYVFSFSGMSLIPPDKIFRLRDHLLVRDGLVLCSTSGSRDLRNFELISKLLSSFARIAATNIICKI